MFPKIHTLYFGNKLTQMEPLSLIYFMELHARVEVLFMSHSIQKTSGVK